MQEDIERLRPTLEDAEATLKDSLAEACALDPSRADTGELIRLEEVLSIASDAAKRAVSVRRWMGERRRPAPESAERSSSTRNPTPVPGHDAVAHPALVHRTFTDGRGVSWSVWSVYPSARATTTSSLRGTFSQGWLAFECEVERRRLSPIPADWDRLDDEALGRLCEVAAPAPSHRRSGAGPRDAVDS